MLAESCALVSVFLKLNKEFIFQLPARVILVSWNKQIHKSQNPSQRLTAGTRWAGGGSSPDQAMVTAGCEAGRARGRRRGRADPRPASPGGVSELDGLGMALHARSPRRARSGGRTPVPAHPHSGAGYMRIGGETSRTGRGLTGDSILQVEGRGGGPEEGHHGRPELWVKL